MLTERNYSIQRGEIWQKLLIFKDKRTRRRRVPAEAAATVLIDDVKYVLPVEITSEGGVLISLTPENTEWFEDGEYRWDAVVTISRSAMLTTAPTMETVPVYGTLTFTTYDNLTPMESDGNPEALEVLT